MNERDRILALVREGIITTEEALVLLENSAKKEGKDAVKMNKTNDFTDNTQVKNEAEESGTTDSEKKDRVNLEKILEQLASEISFFSSQVDAKGEALQLLKKQIKEKEEKRQALATVDELGAVTPEQEITMTRLDEELTGLRSQAAALEAEKVEMEQKMRTLKKEHLETNVKSFSEKLGNKEEWKESANNFSDKLNKVGSQFSKFLTDTVQTVMENVDWKELDFNVKIPGIITNKFQHEFVFEENTATILDFQLANGNVVLQSWDKDTISIAADVKIYGKTEEATGIEAFEARSTIVVDTERLEFHVPNKRIKCDIIVSLPKREYDYVALKLLNGNVTVKDIEGKDFYVKSTNGSMTFTNIKAIMLETDGVNGNLDVVDSTIVDVMSKIINGNVALKSDVVSATVSVVNGDVKLTYPAVNAKRIQAVSVNGDVKLSIPASKSIEGTASSSLGQIKNRIENIEIIKQKNEHTNKFLQFRRLDEESPVMVELKTTTGNIFLKNNEK
ncbi:Hypothetical protein Tpal_1398 [Trichococcus palustris]|uniref:Uncharacterized protein n=1 Tax=Trichococcus palustris TaxID=140314 RepID=A0A143YN22_9LACT|nr:daptomycin-sensing surface protein LiaX [Trichococcus palustris]CZQ91380.1 Hypothetical protein Tpal_1398 [Trichococcus palustris]SFL02151.1 DUF4097 and DUF4098 domain-containing protein YvlB [Trichococcus palustris]